MKAGDGTIACLVFDVKETVADGTYPIILEINELKTLDGSNQTDMPFVALDGAVEIVSVLKGDVDRSGEVDAADATEVKLHLARLKTLTDIQLHAADTLDRGIDKVDVFDATRILMYSVGLIPSLPPPAQIQSFSINPFSSTEAVELSIGSVTGNPGDTVTVPIDISGNTGFSSFNFEIQYDKGRLTPVPGKVENGNIWTGDLTVNLEFDDDIISVIGSSSNNKTADGTIAYVTFKINDNADSGTANVNLNVKSFGYVEEISGITVEVPYSVTNGKVTVGESGGTYNISGSVRSYNPNNPATVTLTRDGDGFVYTATIDATTGSGQVTQEFTMAGVEAGTYTLTVSKPGHLKVTVHNIVVDDDDVSLARDSRNAVKTIVMVCGDINGDGQIDSLDLTILVNDFRKSGAGIANALADLNGDGQVDSLDLTLLVNSYREVNAVIF